MKPTVCIDLDGVLAEFAFATWAPGTVGTPMPGAVKAMQKLGETYTLVVLTARPLDEHPEIYQWCLDHGIPVYAVTNRKPPALAYVDDRAVHHRAGDWEYTVNAIARLHRGLSPEEAEAWAERDREEGDE